MTYYIKELKAYIEAKDQQEFEAKKEKLLARNVKWQTGGRSTSKITLLNGFEFKTYKK
jgi:hypothetical protein